MDRCARSALATHRIKSAENNDNTHQKFFLFFLRRLVVKATRLNDLVIDIKLETCSRVHGFFHALLCDKTKDADCFGLTNTVRAILSLEIGMRIPVVRREHEAKVKR